MGAGEMARWSRYTLVFQRTPGPQHVYKGFLTARRHPVPVDLMPLLSTVTPQHVTYRHTYACSNLNTKLKKEKVRENVHSLYPHFQIKNSACVITQDIPLSQILTWMKDY